MKKIMFASLILVLLGALIMPGIVAPAPAQAWSGTMTCSVTDLTFRVYAGVPTYLMGFIPLDDGQTLTLTHAGGGIAGWTASDDAGWLHESLLVGILSGSGHNDVTVRVNTDGMTVGTHTATITFKITTCGTQTITVPVTVDVIEPAIMGPLGIGVDKDLFKGISGAAVIDEELNEYSGLVTNLLTNPDDPMDMQAIETDGSFNMSMTMKNVSGVMKITGGTLTINKVTQPLTGGVVYGIARLVALSGGALPIPEGFDWGANYIAMFGAGSRETGITSYAGIVIGDINALLPLLDSLGGMFGATEEEVGAPTDEGTGTTGDESASNSEDMVIPLQPILELLPSMMPVLSDLLGNETIMAILSPLLDLLPPIIIVMPMSVLMELFSGLAS